MDSVHHGYARCILTALPWNCTRACNVCCLRPASPSTSDSTVSPSPPLGRHFLALLFFMSVWCANASSLVSFLWMKPHLFLTVELLCCSQNLHWDDLVVPTDRPAPVGAAHVREPRGPLRGCGWCQDCCASAKAGEVGRCWVFPLLLMVAVMVTGPLTELGLLRVPQGPLSAPNPVSLFSFSHFNRCVERLMWP